MTSKVVIDFDPVPGEENHTIALSGKGRGDHKHVCRRCKHEWVCQNFTLKKCETKGVIAALKVNKNGPFCLMCLFLEMAKRHAELRGLELFWRLTRTRRKAKARNTKAN